MGGLACHGRPLLRLGLARCRLRTPAVGYKLRTPPRPGPAFRAWPSPRARPSNGAAGRHRARYLPSRAARCGRTEPSAVPQLRSGSGGATYHVYETSYGRSHSGGLQYDNNGIAKFLRRHPAGTPNSTA